MNNPLYKLFLDPTLANGDINIIACTVYFTISLIVLSGLVNLIMEKKR